MKKRILLLCLTLTALMCFSGCIYTLKRVETYMRIYPDGTVDLRVLQGETAKEDPSGKQTIEAQQKTLTSRYSSMLSKLQQEGYDCEPYAGGDDFIGVVLTIRGVKLEELSDVRTKLKDDTFKHPLMKSFAFDVRGRRVLLGSRPSERTSRLLRPGAPGSLDALPMFSNEFHRLVLELPVPPKAHNAPYVSEDGKTLAWDLIEMENAGVFKYDAAAYDHVYAEFDLPLSPLSIGLLIAVSVILAAAMIRLILQCRRSAARGGEEDVPPADEDAAPHEEGPEPSTES